MYTQLQHPEKARVEEGMPIGMSINKSTRVSTYMSMHSSMAMTIHSYKSWKKLDAKDAAYSAVFDGWMTEESYCPCPGAYKC